jgi:hypothetical protein
MGGGTGKEITMQTVTRDILKTKTDAQLRIMFHEASSAARITKRPSAVFNALQVNLALIRQELAARGLAP